MLREGSFPVNGLLTDPRHRAAMNFSRLFRSRWTALFRAAGMIWLAYDVAGSSTSGNDAAPVDAANLAMLANALWGPIQRG